MQQWPTTYLEVPFCGNSLFVAFWDPVVSWTSRHLDECKRVLFLFSLLGDSRLYYSYACMLLCLALRDTMEPFIVV